MDPGPTFLSCANASGGLVKRDAGRNRMYANSFLLDCFISPRYAGCASAEMAAASFASSVGSATSHEATFSTCLAVLRKIQQGEQSRRCLRRPSWARRPSVLCVRFTEQLRARHATLIKDHVRFVLLDVSASAS